MAAAFDSDFHLRGGGRGPARPCFDLRHRCFGAGRLVCLCRRHRRLALRDCSLDQPQHRLCPGRYRLRHRQPGQSGERRRRGPDRGWRDCRHGGRSLRRRRRLAGGFALRHSADCRRSGRHALGIDCRHPENQSRHQRSHQHAVAVVYRGLAAVLVRSVASAAAQADDQFGDVAGVAGNS